MNNGTTDYYELALRAAGPCAPGDNMREWFNHVADLSVAMLTNRAKQEDFLNNIQRAINKADKGWGVFYGTILSVEMRPQVANRGFIRYTAWDGQAGQTVEEEIRTMPTTSDADALALFKKAEALVGHRVQFFKHPDPTATGTKVPKVVFHLSDEGEVSDQGAGNQQNGGQPSRPAPAQNAGNSNEQGGGNTAPAPAPGNSNAGGNQTPPPPPASNNSEFTEEAQTFSAQDAKKALFQKVRSFGNQQGWEDQRVTAACVIGWDAIGDPTNNATVNASLIEQAYNVGINATDEQIAKVQGN